MKLFKRKKKKLTKEEATKQYQKAVKKYMSELNEKIKKDNEKK